MDKSRAQALFTHSVLIYLNCDQHTYEVLYHDKEIKCCRINHIKCRAFFFRSFDTVSLLTLVDEDRTMMRFTPLLITCRENK